MSIVKNSSKLRKELHGRLKEIYPSDKGFRFKNSEVVRDAEERGFKITPEVLSRYISGKGNGLSEAQIIWLSIRYSINISLVIESTKYDELKALKNLKLIFG